MIALHIYVLGKKTPDDSEERDSSAGKDHQEGVLLLSWQQMPVVQSREGQRERRGDESNEEE